MNKQECIDIVTATMFLSKTNECIFDLFANHNARIIDIALTNNLYSRNYYSITYVDVDESGIADNKNKHSIRIEIDWQKLYSKYYWSGLLV